MILESFGRNYGTALYIKNELYFKETVNNSRYRITFPFILSIEKSDENERLQMLKYIQYPVSKETTKLIQTYTEKKEGFEKSVKIMEEYKIKALEDITELPYSENIEAIKKLIKTTL